MRAERLIRVKSYHRAGRLMPPTARGMRARSVVLHHGQVMDWHSTQNREELLVLFSGQVQLEVQPPPSRASRTRIYPKTQLGKRVTRSRGPHAPAADDADSAVPRPAASGFLAERSRAERGTRRGRVGWRSGRTRFLEGFWMGSRLIAGQCAFLPRQTLHRVVNKSRTIAQYIYVTTPCPDEKC